MFEGMSLSQHVIYGLLWLSFGLVHSVLAAHSTKKLLAPLFGLTYRLVFNLFSILHIGLVIYGGQYLLGHDAIKIIYSEQIQWLLNGSMILGIGIFIIALREYDLGRFSGVTQLFDPTAQDKDEPLQTSGLHRYVRHPLYTGAHLYLWGSVQTEFDLVTAAWASLYLLIGSHFEERKLIADYGDAYREYKARVPSVIPWRGRAISD